MNKRSILEISADILRIAKKAAVKTRIIRKSNLNFKISEKYLEQLKSAGLIVGLGGLNKFIITDKGIKYIFQFESLQKLPRKPFGP